MNNFKILFMTILKTGRLTSTLLLTNYHNNTNKSNKNELQRTFYRLVR
jgi:hypothetical protein